MFAKKIISILFSISIIVVFSWLFYEVLRPEVLPIGSILPKLEYENPNGKAILKSESSMVTIIVLFQQDCDHCMYQLDQFNGHINDFHWIKFILLTTDQRFFKNNKLKNWLALVCAQNVYWGTVKKDTFKELFGSIIYPAIYIFDQKNKLTHKIYGEIKLEKIKDIIKDFGGPERHISGHN